MGAPSFLPTPVFNGSPVVAYSRVVGATAVSNGTGAGSGFSVPSGSDMSLEVSCNINVTTATSHAFTATCTYTDETNVSRTLTLSFTLVAGGAFVTSVANANGAVPYMGIPQHIRAKAGTNVSIVTTGTFTTVVYNFEFAIKQLD